MLKGFVDAYPLACLFVMYYYFIEEKNKCVDWLDLSLNLIQPVLGKYGNLDKLR